MASDYGTGSGTDAGPAVVHVATLPSDLPGRDAIASALDAVGRELAPLASTFFTVAPHGEIRRSAVHGSHLPPAALAGEVERWKARLRWVDPLAPARIEALPRRVVTLHDLRGADRSLLRRSTLRQAYRQIGVVNDARLLIRSAGRVVAGVTLWRALRSGPWTDDQLALLDSLHPLVETAYLAELRATSAVDAQLPDTLTPRQREAARLVASGAANAEVAHALGVSPETAKSHTRAVLDKLDVGSRRELAIRVGLASGRPPSSEETEAPDAAGGGVGARTRPRRSERAGAVRVEGDRTPRTLLAPVLEWSAGWIGALAGGCAVLSARGEPLAEARGRVRSGSRELDARMLRRVQRYLLAPERVARHLDPRLPGAPVVQFGAAEPASAHRVLDDLLAELGLTAPLLAMLRGRGRIAGLIWLCRDADAPNGQDESARALRGVHPLLDLVDVHGMGDGDAPSARPAALADRGLTPRELEIARLVLEGGSDGAIAAELGIAESTVKNHVAPILAKCRVRSRTQLIALMGSSER